MTHNNIPSGVLVFQVSIFMFAKVKHYSKHISSIAATSSSISLFPEDQIRLCYTYELWQINVHSYIEANNRESSAYPPTKPSSSSALELDILSSIHTRIPRKKLHSRFSKCLNRGFSIIRDAFASPSTLCGTSFRNHIRGISNGMEWGKRASNSLAFLRVFFSYQSNIKI